MNWKYFRAMPDIFLCVGFLFNLKEQKRNVSTVYIIPWQTKILRTTKERKTE